MAADGNHIYFDTKHPSKKFLHKVIWEIWLIEYIPNLVHNWSPCYIFAVPYGIEDVTTITRDMRWVYIEALDFFFSPSNQLSWDKRQSISSLHTLICLHVQEVNQSWEALEASIAQGGRAIDWLISFWRRSATSDLVI